MTPEKIIELWKQSYCTKRKETLERMLQAFAAAVIAAHQDELLEGSGGPVAHLRKNGFRFLDYAEPQDDSEVALYNADQLATAVLRERERCANTERALEDLLFHVEAAMSSEVQPFEVEQSVDRARAAIRGTK